MDKLVGQVRSNKEECLRLRNTALVLLLVICDHWESGRSEKPKLELAVQRTETAILNISSDLKTWAKLSSSDAVQNQTNAKISEHKERLMRCIDYLSLAGILQDHGPTTQITENQAAQATETDVTAESPLQTPAPSSPLQTLAPSDRPGTGVPRPPARRQTSVAHIPVVVSAETVFDVDRLAARCAPVPGLSPVTKTLQMIYTSVERVSWNKSRCRELSSKAMTLVFIICDHYDQERADTTKLQKAVERIVQAMHEIDIDVRGWAALSVWESWRTRHDVDLRINEHEEHLKDLTEFLSLAATLQIHDKVAVLQEALKNNPQGSADRKRAEEQLYSLRSAPPGELSDLAPPELACECVRLGSQTEYSGPRNDIWRGRWLDTQDVALIFYKEYEMGVRDYDGIRRFDRQIKVWRRLDSRFVLRLYGWCKFDGETYLVSPWLRNRDVVRYLEGDRGRHRKCISLVYEIAQGLSYLHDQGIIHGSLKPSNILVQDDGRACLSDFSLAKPAAPDAKNTQVNPQVNAFRYQAPEVILDECISKASDVYSWAMTALEIITGDQPFYTWKSPGQLIAQVIMKNQIPARADYKSPVLDKHPEIWEMFMRCWRREPTDRPRVKEIVDLLERIPNPE
ncbi:hypothetical protein M407DRAFT_23868 [Tulasnella calospora MUT 4182]|uniref:Protein kinase domain-containing protein n=1 Tax=Tulasnella calospora MUT 4182 TaxID=1051891 RepID=A0A0C3QIY4_9AGAM|nr:hypothetical protein M407DRAFT_23868 [Tulasnella calospora MUT 4182]